jgi:transcriptional regulator with XRE-family HTH domain
MSEQPATPPGVPEWDTADRMRKALRVADIGVAEIASYLGVTPRSVGNWLSGRIEPSTRTLRLWAQRCDVDYDWLTGAPGGPGHLVLTGQDDVRCRGIRRHVNRIRPLTGLVAA